MDVVKVSTKDDVVTKDEWGSPGVNSLSTGVKLDMKVEEQRKPRVEYIYSKEDLLNLRESPASKLWPSVLSDAHVRHGVWDPEAWHQSVSGKRSGSPAEELRRQQLGIEDGIVLSPQRQSFVQGCQIPQSAPERGAQQERTKSGISRTTDRDREGRGRLTGRVGRGRALDYKERAPLQERNKDSERDERGLKGRERVKDKEQKKKREDSSRARNVHVQKKPVTKPEKEPEWYTFGPSSQFETMELRGFDEEDRDRERRRSASEEIKAILSVGQEVVVNGEVENSSSATSSSPSDDGSNSHVAKKRNVDDGCEKPGTRPFDINQFFLTETLLPFSGGMDQGNSRFCQFFGEPGSIHSSSRSESAGLSSGGANTPRTPSPGANYLFTPIGPSGDDDLDSNTLAHVLGQTKVNVQPLLDEVMSTGQEASKIKGSIRLEDIEAEVRKDHFSEEKELVDMVHNKENMEKGGDAVSSLAGDMLAFNMLVEKMKTSGTLPEKPQPAIPGLPTHLLPRPPSPKRKPPRRTPSPLLDLRRSPSPAELLQQLTMQAPLSDPRPPSPAQVVPQMSRPYSPLEMLHKFNAMAVTPPQDLFSSPLLRRSPSPLAMLAQQRRSPPLGFGVGIVRRSPQSKPLYQKVPQPSLQPRDQQPPRKQSEPLCTPIGTCESGTSDVFHTKSVSSQSSTPHIIDRSFMPTSVIRKIHQDRLGNKTDSGDQTQVVGQVKARPDADGTVTTLTKPSLLSHKYEDTDQYQCTSHSTRGNAPRQPYIGPLVKNPSRTESSAQEAEQVFMRAQLYRQFSSESPVSNHGHPTTIRSDQLSSDKQVMNPDLTVLQKPSAFKPLPGSPQFPYSGLRSGTAEVHSEPPSPLHSLSKTTGSPLRPPKMMTHSAPCTPQRHPPVDNATLFSPQQLVSRGPVLREETNRSLVGGMGQNASSFSEVPLESQMRALQNGLTQVVAAREGRPLSHSHEQHVPIASKKAISSEATPPSRRNDNSSVLHHSPNNMGFQRMNISDASSRYDNPPPKYHSRIHGDNRPIPSHHIPRQFLGSPGPRQGFHIPNGRMSPPSMAAIHGHPGRTPFNSPMPGIGVPPRAAVLPGMMQHHFHPAYLRMLSSGGPPMGIPTPQMRMPAPHSPGRYPALPGKPPLIYGGRTSAGYPAMSPAAMMAARSLHVPPASALQQVHRSHAPSPVMNHPPQSHSPGNGNILSQWFSDEVLQQAGPMPRFATLDLARKVMSVEDVERQQAAAIN